MTLQRKNNILEVSIESDALFKPDHFMNAKHESQSSTFILHNIHNPEWAARALRNVRYIKHIINMGETNITESTSLHMIKVLYDSDVITEFDTEKIDTFTKMVKNAIHSCGVTHHPHL